MKKALWIPQLATVDKITGKTIINADSNITIMNGVINKLHEEFVFYVLLPEQEKCNCLHSEAISEHAYILNSLNAPIHSFALRYDFNFNEMMDIITTSQPDIIVNNTPSLTRNIKAVAYLAKNKAKIISFLHFLDHPEENKVPCEVSYFIRQMEGILCADKAVFQSYTVAEKAMQALNTYLPDMKHLLNPLIDAEGDHLHYDIWNATYSQDAINKYQGEKQFDKKTIVFPNRLSSTNYSNHLRFFEAIRNISKTRNDFQVIVNNPTKYMSYIEIEKVCPNLLVLNNGELLDTKQYFEMLWEADIGVALFTQEGHGGVSSKEFQAAGCLSVFPKVNEYQHLMPSDYQGFCKSDLSNLEDALNCVLDVARTPVGNELASIGHKMIYERDSIEFNIHNVKRTLETI